VGPRTRLSFASGLEQVSDNNFRLLFRMSWEDLLALHAGVAHRLAVDDGMATFSSGSLIPSAVAERHGDVCPSAVDPTANRAESAASAATRTAVAACQAASCCAL